MELEAVISPQKFYSTYSLLETRWLQAHSPFSIFKANYVVADFTVASPIFTQVSKRQGRVRRWRSGIRHRVAVTHKGRLLSRSRIWGNSRKRHQPLPPILRRMS